jgi:uncharacterized protein (DUF433 family)
MDWEGCEHVERVAGKVGGRPVIKGTRIEPDLLLVEADGRGGTWALSGADS